MDEKELLKEQIERTIQLIDLLPEGRKIYYDAGLVMLEVSKEEAKKLLQEELEKLEGTGGGDKTENQQGGER
ncbi:MAG: hypothetical protein GXN94_03485 [Aquificae bacterium]|nr:hypothetical protein [Aquificota bacterium]